MRGKALSAHPELGLGHARGQQTARFSKVKESACMCRVICSHAESLCGTEACPLLRLGWAGDTVGRTSVRQWLGFLLFCRRVAWDGISLRGEGEKGRKG